MPEVYDPILDSETDPDQPLKSSLAKRWAKNHIAVAEGAQNGPVTAAGWHPYDKLLINDSNTGLFYDVAASGAVAIITTPDFADGYEYRVRYESLSTSASVNLSMDLFQETSAAYSAGLLLSAMNAASVYTGEIELPYVRRSTIAQPAKGRIALHSVVGWNGSNVIDSLLVMSSAQKITRARIFPASGNIDAGKFFLDRRLAVY